jgi:transcriptional regulator
MYTPSHFEQLEVSALHALIYSRPLAALVAMTPEGIDVEHVPLLLSDSGGTNRVLKGHVARANPVWQKVGAGSEVLAIFQGPDHYVSPNWYPSKREHGKVVPTWNYVVVHARGTIAWNHDPVWLRQLVEAFTQAFEPSDDPWKVSDAPEEFVARMLTAIVGFEIRISELTGKWKLSQNRSAADRQGVVAALKRQPGLATTEILNWMNDV